MVEKIAERSILGGRRKLRGPARQRRGGHELPEFTQLLETHFRWIAGNKSRIDRSDRDARNPIRIEMRLGQRLVDSRLIGAEGAAALKQQRDAFERRPGLHLVRLSTQRFRLVCRHVHSRDSSDGGWEPWLGGA
jgi:hypothetical protein